jgi:threonine dehydrogenase-like Zn-dependent dehydrogenase
VIAIHLQGGDVEIRKSSTPKRPKGYALLRLRLAGICNTDLELQRGYYGFRGRPGHEFVADVVAADSAECVGKRVVGEINLACQKCDWCRRGLQRHCPHRTVLGIVKHPGAFAQFLTLPEKNLHLVPRAMRDERAVFTEPVAAACEILDQVKIPKETEVAVLGDGKLGLLISQTLAAHRAKVHQFGRHREKLRIAERAGVTGEVVRRFLPVSRYGVVVDATGSSSGLEQAIRMTQPRGTVVCKSTVHDEVPIDMAPVIVNEISLVGSRCGRFEPALRLLATQKIHTDEMIDSRFPLSRGDAAFARAAERGALKVLLEA